MNIIAKPDIDTAFRRIKSQALANTEKLYDGTKTVIMVGTATCGRAAGALEILEVIKNELSQEGLNASVVEVGCMGHCYAEPLVVINKPDNPSMLYGYVTPEIARRLVKDYIAGEDPSLEFTLGALEENELIPPIYDLPRFDYEKHIILEDCGYIDTARR